MTKKCHMMTLALLVASLTGCATPYWSDRKQDALDVFTLAVGKGGGAKIRVGPFHAGLAAIFDRAGLRGGLWGDQGDCRDVDAPVPSACPAATGQGILFGADLYSPTNELRGKSFTAVSEIPFVYNNFQSADIKPCSPPATFLTQAELAGGVIGTLRLGFNLGELADFTLGWANIDIYHDDINRAMERHPDKAAQTIGAPASLSGH